MEEADFFSDDDLDQIPDNTLLELEHNAITSTQKPQHDVPRQTTRPNRAKQAHNASSLTRSRSINQNIPWRPPQRLTQPPRVSQGVSGPPSQQSAYEEENVINLADDTPIADWSQTQHLGRKPAETASRSKQQSTIDEETAAAFAAADAELFAQRAAPVPRPSHQDVTGGADTIELEARIEALEADAARARQAEEQARRALEAKLGEITIVRANAERERKEHDRKVQAMQRGYAEEHAKHKVELEAGRKEKEKMQTDNRFLQHDLAREADRVNRLNGPGKARTAGAERDTPRKLQRTGLGDGFNDDEVHNFSPSRSRDRPKDATPRAGSKRKRSAQDSPVASLAFAKPSTIPREDSIDSVSRLQASPAVNLPAASSDQSDSVRFMQRLLEYRPLGQSTRSLEVLALHHLSSTKGRPLSSLLMDALSTTRNEETTLAMQVVSATARMWKMCLAEQNFSSLALVVDIMQFSMHHELPSRINRLAEEVVPLALQTLELVTLPVVRAHLKATYSTSAETVSDTLTKHIDVYQITAVLDEMCQACTLSQERIETFWRLMDFTNSMLLLHKALPMDRVLAGLRMLCTSALRDTFGAIHEDPVHQEQREKDTVYRLTFAFFDIPAVPLDEPAYDESEIALLRISVLDVLTKLCESEHGSRLLATHTHFVGHIVRFLDEQIRKLYCLAPALHQMGKSTPEEMPDKHELVVKTINMAMRILHYLLSTHGGLIDLSEKFAVVTGGYHKFLVGMTRLAFIEQPSIHEQGIEEEAIEAAHSILDAFLTPDDGEAVARPFETPQASRKTALQMRSDSVDEDAMETDDMPRAPD